MNQNPIMPTTARTASATPTPMPAEAPVDRPPPPELEASAVPEEDEVGFVDVDEEDVLAVGFELVTAEVDVLLVDEIVAASVEYAASSIFVMLANAHFTPTSLVSLVKATVLLELSDRW
jgi:hypothetical protein